MAGLESRESGQVQSMFGGIARRYDLLNHLLSGNMDRRWRRKAAAALPADDRAVILDLCGGTGDFGLEVLRQDRAGMVLCADFTIPMLEVGRDKFQRQGVADRCHPVGADGLRLPLRTGSVDGVTVGFGVRNFSNLSAGLREIHRVLRPRGTLSILEFSRPTAPVLAGLYRFYLKQVLPRIGDSISRKDGPYGYLAATIGRFPDAPTLAGIVREAGFEMCDWTLLTGGIVAIHRAQKAG
ncbi:MAG: ubiquinone/menaquinone biosynthesis methyltransferase [Acidobacteria bacterium]|uniref:Demethylmenaquinone methyltransferase n=1 Tax=Candidatus Polarisedimenticola svalbardensis TaxID=2886004 RepID=A0A8J6Y386_9BACT|nr:ubiquinone/menaquinone biosynthesis methyltransferase [Candidatus Polarisedimenticola svalbardensis]